MEPQTAPAITGLMDPEGNNATLEQSTGFTLGQSLGATAASTFVTNPAMALRDLYEYGTDRLVREADLTADEANQQYGHIGLSFSRPVSRHYADILAEQKRQETVRQTMAEKGPQGIMATAARFGVGLGVSALDPINVASAFIPAVGATRLAAAANVTSKVGTRAITGAVGGFVGAAAVEPLVYAGAQARQADYDLADSLLNLTFGTALGTGLHVAGGYISDNFLSRKAASMVNPANVRMPKPSNTAEVVEQMPAEQRENAMRTAIGQAASGQAVDVTPIMRTAPQTVAQNLNGSIQTVYDAAGRSYDTQFEVIDAADLIAANGDLQPRDRTRIGSDDQINRLAQDMIPERLAESTDAATGAPIIGPDNVVESGNGRVSFIRQAYANGYASAEKYKSFLKSRGVDVSQFKEPILVRRRISELSDDERKAFVVNAQAVGTMALSASERAGADARLVDRALEVAPLASPNLRAGTSLKFVRAFLAQIPQSERAGLITSGGELAQAGIQRMRNGLLARAFDDADLLASVLEATDDNLRTLGNSLYEVSIPWADMRNGIRVGEHSPFLDTTDDLLNAVRFLRKAKDSDVSFREAVEQGELMGIKGRDTRTVETNQWLALMLKDNGKGDLRLVSKEELTQRINRYVELARNTVPTNDMFGAPPATPDDIFKAVRKGIMDEAEAGNIKPNLIDVPEGGVIKPKDLATPKDAPKLDVEAVRQQVYEDVLPAEQRPDYKMAHQAPGPEFGAQGFDVTANGMYPKDFYSKDGLQFYGTGMDKADKQSYQALMKIKDKPNEKITIYRAVPKNVNKINVGDWITLSKEYANQHGISNLDGDFKIISKEVTASDIWTNADSLNEFGYYPVVKENLTPAYATAENTPPERRATPSNEPVAVDSIDGDSMATNAALEQAEATISAKEQELDADLVDLENMLKGMGELTEAEKNSLAEADGFIANQPTIREAIMAAANCVIGKG